MPAIVAPFLTGACRLMRPPYNGETYDDVIHYAKIFTDAVDVIGPIPLDLQKHPVAGPKVQELLNDIKK